MITKFKIFENINESEPKIGDYVICKTRSTDTIEFKKYVDNNIGKIVDNYLAYYYVKFKEKTYIFTIGNILYWAKNKEDIEVLIQANKYNL